MTESQAIDDTVKPTTSRMIFLTMAGIVTIVWLFAAHGPIPGLFFGLLIFAIARSIYLGKRWLAIVTTILFLSCWISLQCFGPYTSFKNRVRWKIGVEELQDWAVGTLDSHQRIKKAEAIEDEIPEDIREVLPNVYLIPDSSGVPEYLWFRVDPNRDTHGLMVGRPGFVPDPGKYHTQRLADGVWAYRYDQEWY